MADLAEPGAIQDGEERWNTLGGDYRQMQRTPLAAAPCGALRTAGQDRNPICGYVFLALIGEQSIAFVTSRRGEIEVVNPYTDETPFPLHAGSGPVHGRHRLSERRRLVLPMRTVRDTRVIEVPREAMLTLMSQIPRRLSDIIITVFSARSRTLLDDRNGSLRLIGER